MSYGTSLALQKAVFSALAGVVQAPVYDALPAGQLPSLYVLLGPEDVTARGDSTGEGARHDFVVSVVSDGAGFAAAKGVAVAVSDVLMDADFVLERGTLSAVRLLKASARRLDGGALRQIDLRFRALTDDF